MAAKDFGAIESDYAFFMAHATEAEQDAAAYARAVRLLGAGPAPIRMLDFGCGDGAFTERFLQAMHWPPENLELTLVEPVERQLTLAAERVARFTQRPIGWQTILSDGLSPAFELILSNHVLYYVEDLDATLHQLHAVLVPGGTLLLAMAGWDNVLMELWKQGFAQLGEAVPYHSAVDVEAGLRRLDARFEKSNCPYRLQFPDSRENRLKILRFLFAEHLSRLSVEPLLAQFNPHTIDGWVAVNTCSCHFVVNK